MSVSNSKPTMLPNEIRARSVQFLHQQTEIYINQGQFEDAIKACNQLLQIQSDYAPGYKLMADIFQRQGKLQDAQEWYTLTLQLQPNRQKFMLTWEVCMLNHNNGNRRSLVIKKLSP